MKRAAQALVVIGTFNFLNAIFARYVGASRDLHIASYVNTHYITIVNVFAGISYFYVVGGHFYSEVFSFFMNFLAIIISTSAAIADAFNYFYITEPKNQTISKPYTKNYIFHAGYSILDFLTSVAAIPLCLLIVKELLSSKNNLPRQNRYLPLLGCGTGIIVLGSTRLIIYLIEIYYLRQLPELSVYFLHYTLDEPAWISISIASGALVVLSAQGSPLIRGVALTATSTLLWPTMFYIWIDYRLLDASLTKYPAETSLLKISMAAEVMEIGTFLATSLLLATQFSSRSKIQLSDSVRSLFRVFALVFFILCLSTFVIDIYALTYELFYRFFHGSEQRTPFMCGLLAIFCLLAASPATANLVLPVCVTVAVLTARSTTFHILTYMYLSTKGYFNDAICDTLMLHSDCKQRVDVLGATVHFVETLLVLVALLLSLLLCGLIMRLARHHEVKRSLNDSAKKEAKSIQFKILALGVLMELMALFILGSLIFVRKSKIEDSHPLIYIFNYIFHISLALGLVILPLYQILTAEEVSDHPLSLHSLLGLAIAHFVSILTQLDYRGTGEELTNEWKYQEISDLVSLFCTFFTVALLIRLHRLGNRSLLETEQFSLDFENPLELVDETQGAYVQVRTDEENTAQA